MDESMRAVVETMAERVRAKEAELSQLKKAVNVFCRDAGIEPLYADTEPTPGISMKMRPDEYYGKPFSTAVRDYMKRRGQAVSAEEILSGLEQGSYDFNALGWQKEGRVRSMAAALAKNTAVFHRLPNGLFGLLEWYPEAADRKKATKRAEAANNKEAAEAEEVSD